MTTRRLPHALALAAGLLAAGCSGDRLSESLSSGPAVTSPPVTMAGRWRLVSVKGGACGMMFTGTAAEGSIAPEGGCPANFSTARRWVLGQGSLAIQDQTRKPLVVMRDAGGGRFEGDLATHGAIWLER